MCTNKIVNFLFVREPTVRYRTARGFGVHKNDRRSATRVLFVTSVSVTSRPTYPPMSERPSPFENPPLAEEEYSGGEVVVGEAERGRWRTVAGYSPTTKDAHAFLKVSSSMER